MNQELPKHLQNTESASDLKMLICKVDRIIFHNENNNYTIMSVIGNDGGHHRLLGNIAEVKVNDTLKATGLWNKDEKYGWQFKAELMEIISADVECKVPEHMDCKIREVRVLKAKTGFASAKADSPEKGTIKLSGRLAKVRVGATIGVYGKWTHDERYGDEFQVSHWEYKKENKQDSSNLVIPDTVTTIAAQAFEGCEDLLSIIIPDSVTSIGSSAFNGCKRLQSVTLPSSIEEIAEHTFLGCESLESITIPDSVNTICERAFEGCAKLSSICISKAIESIDGTAFLGCPSNIVYKTEEVDWEDVEIIDSYITIPEPLGGRTRIYDRHVNASMNPMLTHLRSKLPKLIVEYRINSIPAILNPEVLHDAITVLCIKNDLRQFVKSQKNSSDVLRAIDNMSSVSSDVFTPYDMTPYLDYLSDKQDIDHYPIIPIEEYIGGSIEEGALFTIINKEQPYIVWENYNDSRATYVFPCTRENYQERRQLIFDFIVTEEPSKRQFLRTNDCFELFGSKPMMLVHNNFESWSTRLISMIETNNKGNKMEDNKMIIYLWYKVDPEEIFDSFSDEMDVDEDGNYIMDYFEGSRVLLAERKIVVKEGNTLEVERECIVESMSDDEYDNFIRKIEREERRKSHSKPDSKDDIYKDLCQQAVDMIAPDEFSYALENDDIYVELRIDNSTVYTTSTCPSYEDEL